MRLFLRSTAIGLVSTAAILAGCANSSSLTTPSAAEGGLRLIAQGHVEEGLAELEAVAKAQPRRSDLYSIYLIQRTSAVNALVRDADRLRAGADFDGADSLLRSAQRLESNSDMVRSGFAAVARARVQQSRLREAQTAVQAGDVARADRIVREVLAEDATQREARVLMKTITEMQSGIDTAAPQLRQALQRTISLELRDVPLSTVFDIISRGGNINFIIDRDVKTDARASFFVHDSTIEDVLKIVLLTHQLNRKILNSNSLLIYPATQGKLREYQDLAVRSFYLANAEAKQTAAMIKALVKTRDIFVDEKLNLVIMRDTPDAIRLAEQLVATQDIGEPEVMLDLEVLEVSTTLLEQFGLRYPDQISFFGLDSSGNPSSDPYRLSAGSGGLRGFVGNPVLLLNLARQDGGTNILANPRIRVKNREKAKVHIGERVPVVTTTATANVGVASSVSYLETGLKLDVEPNVYLQDEVAIKVELEVSNILEQLNIQGTVAYRLGTRNAATTLRLKNGETQVLAGLIDNEDRKTYNSVPLAGELPVLGRLFRNDGVQGTKSEVILLVTPHIVRNIARPEAVHSEFAAGTDAVPGVPPLRIGDGKLTFSAGAGGPVIAEEKTPAADSPLLQMTVIVPAEVRTGQEFTLGLSLPDGAEALTASVQITYDPQVIKPVSIAPPPDAIKAPDIAQVVVGVSSNGIAGVPQTPTEVRFQVLGNAAAAQAEISFLMVGPSRRVVAPSSVNISVVK